MNTAALLADAMTDYVLTVDANRAAPAGGVPAHMAAWLEAHGYQFVHHSRSGTGAVAAMPDHARRITAAAEPRSARPRAEQGSRR